METKPKRLTRRNAHLAPAGAATNKIVVAKQPKPGTAAPKWSWTDGFAYLSHRMVIVLLTGVSIIADGPLSLYGFNQGVAAVERFTGYAWQGGADAKWVFWLIVTAVSTLSQAYAALNWKALTRTWQSFIRGALFIILVLAPVSVFDLVDTAAGVYALFQPINLAAIDERLLFFAAGASIFGSIVCPTFAIIFARDGTIRKEAS